MNHTGHIFVGLASAAAAGYLLSILQIFIFPPLPLTTLIAVTVLGALLPDIDLAQSKISKLIEVIFVIVATFFLQPLATRVFTGIVSWIASFLASIAILFIVLFPLRLKHRGTTHSLGAALVFAIAIGIVSGVTAGAIGFVAYASHVVVDKL